jgi:hypothetical protein
MSTTTMTAMHATLTSARVPSKLSLATAKFLQQRASLPEMPVQGSHLAAFAGVALRLVAATVPVTVLAWLSLAG